MATAELANCDAGENVDVPTADEAHRLPGRGVEVISHGPRLGVLLDMLAMQPL